MREIGRSIAVSWLIFIGFVPVGSAHPVSYRGSHGLMGYHSPIVTHNQINHSFRHWFAAGIHHIRRPSEPRRQSTFASGNFLLKRWNGNRLQGNLYAILGIGNSAFGSSDEVSGLGLVQFDFEDRDYYFLAKHQRIVNTKRVDFTQSIVRVGFSPYVEGYDGIHSWLILEWQQSLIYSGGGLSDLTPFLRIFYRNLLFELGQSFDGVTKFNYVVHF